MSAPTVVEAVGAWFEQRAPRKDSPHTLTAYARDVESVLTLIAAERGERAHEVTVDALTLPALRRAFARWARDHSPATMRRCHSSWSVFFEYLVSEELVGGSPMPGVAKPKAPRRQPKAFSEDDAARIVRALVDQAVRRRDPWPELDSAVVLTAMVSGARASELLGANVGDVVRSAGSERLRVLGKGRAERGIPLEPVIVTVLGDYLDSRRARFPDQARQRGVAAGADAWAWWPATAALFVDRRGERMRQGALTYLVRLVYRTAGVDAVRARGALTHALRHTAATRMAERGATATQLMDFLGHRSLQTSQTYVSATAAAVREAAASNPVYGLLDR